MGFSIGAITVSIKEECVLLALELCQVTNGTLLGLDTQFPLPSSVCINSSCIHAYITFTENIRREYKESVIGMV